MSADAGKVTYEIDADTGGLGAKLKEAEATVKGFAANISKSLDSQAGSFLKAQLAYDGIKNSLKAVGGFLVDSVQESFNAARQWALVETNVKNAGLSYDDLKPKIEAVANASLQLGFDDEDTAQSLSKLILVTGDYNKGLALLTLSQDLARNKGVSLEDASKAVTLATQGNTKALKEYGIEVTDNMTVGDALAKTYEKVKGSAQATVNPIDVLTQKFANLKQAVGDQLAPTVTELGKTLDENSGALTEMATTAGNAFAIILKGAIFIAKGVMGAFDILGSYIDKKIADVIRIGAAGAAILAKVGIISEESAKSVKTLADNFDDASNILQDKALDLFQKNTAAIEKTGEASKDTAKTLKEMGGASAAAVQAAKDGKKAFEDFQKSLLDAKDKADDLANSLKTKLSDAFKQFNEDTKSTVDTSKQNLADIVVKATSDIADLQKQITEEQAKTQDQQSADSIKKLQAEIAEKQKILTDSASFTVDLNTRIADKQKAIDDLTTASAKETDPIKKAVLQTEIEARTSALTQTKSLGDLDKEIADRKKFAALDEFKQFETNLFKEMDLKEEAFVTEVKQTREKLEIANAAEADITAFYQSQLTLRQQSVDAFAISTSAKLKQVGADAKAAMDALNALQSQQSRGAVAVGGKAMGGFTSGGEMVHGGEYVIPRSLVRALPNLVNQIEGMRTGGGDNNSKSINAPITINANMDSGVDVRAVGRELAWELGKR